jgi:hypothetical protein
MKFDIGDLLKSVEKIQIGLKSDKLSGNLCEDLSMFHGCQ